jgi:hypothetical protein
MPAFYFIHNKKLDVWSITDPVQWCLDHKTDPMLERAWEGLSARSPDEGERILRLVLRRCGLILVEIDLPQVNVQHWGQLVCDLRPFFKKQELTGDEIRVRLLNRKKEIATEKCGRDFLYGAPLAPNFPFEIVNQKWLQRSVIELDDDTLAPLSQQEVYTRNVGPITWGTLKSIWQRNDPDVCPNCEQSTSIVVSYRMRVCGFYRFSPDVIRICAKCRRSFVDSSRNMREWIRENVDQRYWPEWV